jgi:uncharacterized delta-60 repeat protein
MTDTGQRSRRVAGASAFVVLALAVLAAQALAAAGGFDNSFSGDGRRTISFGSGGGDEGSAVAIQGDGKLVVAGTSDAAPTRDFGVARFMPGGQLDNSFSGDGRKRIDFAGGDDNGAAIVIQPNGKIVVAGAAYEGASRALEFAFVRLNPNGSLDQTFSGDGRKTFGFGNGAANDFANAVAIDRNGRIVAAGYSDQATTGSDFAIARLLSNGMLDHSFSGDGRRTARFPNGNGVDIAGGVAIEGSGKIVVAGRSFQGSPTNTDFALARFNAGGGLDHTFSGDGKATADFGNTEDHGSALALQRDGRIVMTGYSVRSVIGDNFAIARFKTGGAPDGSFSGDGKRLFGFANGGGDDDGDDVAIQSDGKIVVVGYSEQSGHGTDSAIARLRPGGRLDPAFSGDGRRTYGFGNSGNDDYGEAVAIQRNGRIVVSGGSEQPSTGFDFALARLLAG